MTTRKIKKGFREMHSKMQDQMNQQRPGQQEQPKTKPGSKPKVGDYIDFEEVK
jgi:hypothetical protein